jgi:hypothetical protein
MLPIDFIIIITLVYFLIYQSSAGMWPTKYVNEIVGISYIKCAEKKPCTPHQRRLNGTKIRSNRIIHFDKAKMEPY